MKDTTLLAVIWVACAVAVSVAIGITGRLVPLWALLIPMMVQFSTPVEKGKSKSV